MTGASEVATTSRVKPRTVPIRRPGHEGGEGAAPEQRPRCAPPV